MSGAIEVDLSGALSMRASFERWDGVELVVSAPLAAPPGARLDAQLVDDAHLRFRMKAIRCRRRDDDRFEITLRVLELSRAARASLDALGNAGARP